MTTPRGFRTSEAARLSGLTQRQLDHWDRTGLFKPALTPAKGRGKARFYSFLDVVQLRVVKKLLDAGLSVHKLRKSLRFLRNNLQEQNLAEFSLVTDGTNLFLLKDNINNLAVDLTRQGQVVLMLNVGLVAQEVSDTFEMVDEKI